MNQITAISRFTDLKTSTWRLVAAFLLFLGLGWLSLEAHAQMSAEAAFADALLVSARAFAPADALSATFGESTGVFTLTVLNTNDTWGYLDPCG